VVVESKLWSFLQWALLQNAVIINVHKTFLYFFFELLLLFYCNCFWWINMSHDTDILDVDASVEELDHTYSLVREQLVIKGERHNWYHADTCWWCLQHSRSQSQNAIVHPWELSLHRWQVLVFISRVLTLSFSRWLYQQPGNANKLHLSHWIIVFLTSFWPVCSLGS